MKNISIIGSDIVCRIAQYLPKDKYYVKNEFISINPISFVNDERKSDFELKKVNREAYIEDLNKVVFDKIRDADSDIIIIDLLDCRLNVNNYIVEGNEVFVTENNGLVTAINGLDFILKNKILPLELAESEWFDIFKKYKTKLIECASDKKIIFIDVKSAATYLSKCKHIYNLFPLDYRERMYGFFTKIYSIMRLVAPEFLYLPGFDVYFCDEIENEKVFSYSLQKEFYEYASKAIDMLCDGASISDIAKLRNEFNLISLKRYNQADSREKCWHKVVLNDFSGVYYDDFGNYVDTSNNKINIKLNGQNNKLVINKGCNVSGAFFELGNKNSVTLGDGTIFKGNSVIRLGDENKVSIGSKCVFDNTSLVSKSKNDISFGNNNKLNGPCSFGIDSYCNLNISDNNDIWKIEVHLFNYASLIVGNNNFLNKTILITCHSYTKTIINNFCIFASEVEIINGDGHSIFDNISKEKVNDMKLSGNVIEVRDHVWLCRRAMLLSGSHIGNGCIVGAGAIVNKNLGLNNCLIAGIPAKIKKKNISWCRNNDTSDIADCAPYNLMTDNEEEEGENR